MRAFSQSRVIDPFQWIVVTVAAMIFAAFAWHEHYWPNRALSLLASVALVLGYALVRRAGLRPSFSFFRWFVVLYIGGELAIYVMSHAFRGRLNAHAVLTSVVVLVGVVALGLALRSFEHAVFRRGGDLSA
jgi:hypothetical protein